MVEKTTEQLEAEIQTAQLEIERRQLEPLQAVVDAFNKPTVAAALQAAKDNLMKMTGERRQQAQNLITVLENSPEFLRQQIDAINARVNPPVEVVPEPVN